MDGSPVCHGADPLYNNLPRPSDGTWGWGAGCASCTLSGCTNCAGDTYLDEATGACVSCGANARAGGGGGCTCDAGYFDSDPALSALTCSECGLPFRAPLNDSRRATDVACYITWGSLSVQDGITGYYAPVQSCAHAGALLSLIHI